MALLATGCSGAEARMLAQPVIDTLPGGIPRIISPGPTRWEGTEGWRLELVGETTGEPETPGELIDPQSVALDEWGRAFVVDQKPSIIKVYGRDGTFIRSIGGEGGGPGEIRVGFVAVHAGYVVVQDPQATRTSVWDTTGTFIRSWSSSCCFWSDIQVDQQGWIYLPTVLRVPVGEQRREGTPYVRWTMTGDPVDTAWVPNFTDLSKQWIVSTNEGGRNVMHMSTPVPLMPRVVTGFNPAGGFLVGSSGGYEIAVSPGGSDTASVFGRTWTPAAVTAERRQYEVDRMVNSLKENYPEDGLRQSFKADDIPGTAPAFVALYVDGNGNRWVRLDPGMDSTTTRFDVFDSGGALLGTVTAPTAMPMYGRMVFGRDELVVARENADGVPVLARFQVRKP